MTTASQTEFKDAVKARSRLEEIVSESGHVLKREGKNDVCNCMFHTEKSASFKIDIDGQFWKCFGCGKGGDVFAYIMELKRIDFPAALDFLAARAGMTRRDDGPRNTLNAAKSPPPKTAKIYTREKLKACLEFLSRDKFKNGKLTAIYEYANPQTQAVELIVARIDFLTETNLPDKAFYQARAVPDGFSFGGLSTNPIYNRARVAGADFVVIVEGEKCVHALHALNIVATTSPGGAQSGSKADWSPLAGKSVFFWRDFDKSGNDYQADVLSELEKLTPPPQVRVVDVAALGLGDGGDVADFIERVAGDEGSKAFDVTEVLGAARPIGPLADLHAELDDAIAGRRRAIPFVWAAISTATKALLPGTVTILCGGPGATKSLCVVQNLIEWNKAGVPCVALMCEDGRVYHLRRAMAQLAGNGKLTDDDFCRENPGIVTAAQGSTAAALQSLAPCIESPADANPLTADALLEWIRAKAEAGFRIIAIDPITIMEKSKFGFQDDQRFMTSAKRIIEKHRASLLLISHPKKSPMHGAPTLSDIAGGAAYERFAAAVLYLRSCAADKVTIRNSFGRESVTGNRSISILKARNSYGAGEKVALWFDSSTLTLKELGVIVQDED